MFVEQCHNLSPSRFGLVMRKSTPALCLTSCRRQTWILLILLALLWHPALISVQAGCRIASQTPICCSGKQVNCFSYTYETNYLNRSRFSPSLPATMSRKKCFCDESCISTNDCCPDYRDVCGKPVVNCIVSNWDQWGKCSQQCGRGIRVRSRRVVQQAMHGGQHCPVLEESVACEGYLCASRRVGRSGNLMIPYMQQARAEVAHLLPSRDDALRVTRRWNMRWDVRRKLYLGRLIQQNKTEQPEPEPYCAVYEITYTNQACRPESLLWPYTPGSPASRNPYKSNAYSYGQQQYGGGTYRFDRQPDSSVGMSRMDNTRTNGHWISGNTNPMHDWYSATSQYRTWMDQANMLQKGNHVCVTCYSGYMREDLGFRCSGTGLLNIETRWRALRTADCQGRFRMISMPQRACTCEAEKSSFIFI